MARVQKDLRLNELLVVYPGTRAYELAEGIRTHPLRIAIADTRTGHAESSD